MTEIQKYESLYYTFTKTNYFKVDCWGEGKNYFPLAQRRQKTFIFCSGVQKLLRLNNELLLSFLKVLHAKDYYQICLSALFGTIRTIEAIRP